MDLDIFKTIKINRKLNEIPSRHFSSTFPAWKDNGKMTISGDQVRFNDLFVNFGSSAAIRRIFGKKTEEILSKLDVAVYEGMGYLWVDNRRGRCRLMASRNYILKGKRAYIYLDVVHELVHVKQNSMGIDLWNEKYDYLERPTEIEAYITAAKEARRLGMPSEEMRRYLNAPWSSRASNREFYLKIIKALKK